MLLTPDWTISLVGDHPTARLAATELQRTLQRIGGPALPIGVANPDGQRILLRHGTSGDGFTRMSDGQGMQLRGDGPRGLLYAVYDLLEALGCRWFGPGPSGEHLPRYEQVTLPTETLADRPAIGGRCLIIGHDLMLADGEQWIIWAARARLNTIFIHTISARLALGACRLQRWQARRRTLLPLLLERGMQLELGGHHLRDLLPRARFQRSPELFRFDGRRRTPDHNCCTGNPATLKILAQATIAFARRFPEAAVYHLWPDDILFGGWCSCPLCRDLSPADQALRAANACAAGLAEVRPNARLAYLAYHDTEAPPQQVTPAANVDLLFAPRPRSYAHGIGGAESALNRVYSSRLAANIARFGPQRSAVFEYYLDGILFKSAPPPLPEVIAADMRHYRNAGVQSVQVLLTGDRPWHAIPPNAALFARLAWEPDADPSALLAEIAAARAPRTPEALYQAYCALGQAWRAALDHDPAERPTLLLNLRDLVSQPPTDILDMMARRRQAASSASISCGGRFLRWRKGALPGRRLPPAHSPKRQPWPLNRPSGRPVQCCWNCCWRARSCISWPHAAPRARCCATPWPKPRPRSMHSSTGRVRMCRPTPRLTTCCCARFCNSTWIGSTIATLPHPGGASPYEPNGRPRSRACSRRLCCSAPPNLSNPKQNLI